MWLGDNVAADNPVRTTERNVNRQITCQVPHMRDAEGEGGQSSERGGQGGVRSRAGIWVRVDRPRVRGRGKEGGGDARPKGTRRVRTKGEARPRAAAGRWAIKTGWEAGAGLGTRLGSRVGSAGDEEPHLLRGVAGSRRGNQLRLAAEGRAFLKRHPGGGRTRRTAPGHQHRSVPVTGEQNGEAASFCSAASKDWLRPRHEVPFRASFVSGSFPNRPHPGNDCTFLVQVLFILGSPHNPLIVNSARQVMWHGRNCLDRVPGTPATGQSISCNTASVASLDICPWDSCKVGPEYLRANVWPPSDVLGRCQTQPDCALESPGPLLKINQKEAAQAAPGGTSTFLDNRSQSWLHVRIIGRCEKDPHLPWLPAEMLKPIHWAEDVNSNNSRSSLPSTDEKDTAMHWSREISISFTFRIFNYFIPFDLPWAGATALNWY